MPVGRRTALAGLAALSLGDARAQAAPFPAKPLTLVVPFPAGGPADIFGRHLAQGMAAGLGQPVVVENRSGAAGVTGIDHVAKAGTDAHVMGLVSASAGAIMQSLMARMPYDPEKDLSPIVLVVRVQEVLAVGAKLGTGGITHLAGELFKRETGTDILHVPYRGAAPAVKDLLAGVVDMTILDLPALLPHIRSGALKALAVTSDTRAALLPDLPTMRELGFPKVNSDNWYGLVSPAAAARSARERLHAAATAALAARELVDAYAAVGGIAGGGSSEAFAAFLRREVVKWAEVIKLANVKLE